MICNVSTRIISLGDIYTLLLHVFSKDKSNTGKKNVFSIILVKQFYSDTRIIMQGIIIDYFFHKIDNYTHFYLDDENSKYFEFYLNTTFEQILQKKKK